MSDARTTQPSFDEMVELIKKLFTDYLEDHVKSKPSEIKKSWERYRTLNHLWQDGHNKPTFWDVAKAFKWAAEYRDEIGGQLTLYNDQWTIISEDEDGNENETQDLTPGNVAELYCLQKGLNNDIDESAAGRAVWTTAETKPEHNVGVLVFIPGEDNHITSGMWDIDNKWVLLDEYRTPEEEVTHWMALPSFPDGYIWNEIPDELKAAIKKVAEEELGKFPVTTTAGRESEGVDEWIDVNERLPELTLPLTWWDDDTNQREVIIPNHHAHVLAYNQTLGVYKAEYDRSGWKEISSRSIVGTKETNPTHWKPLPEPPKRKQQKEK